jgi:hypothetical protein
MILYKIFIQYNTFNMNTSKICKGLVKRTGFACTSKAKGGNDGYCGHHMRSNSSAVECKKCVKCNKKNACTDKQGTLTRC